MSGAFLGLCVTQPDHGAPWSYDARLESRRLTAVQQALPILSVAISDAFFSPAM